MATYEMIDPIEGKPSPAMIASMLRRQIWFHTRAISEMDREALMNNGMTLICRISVGDGKFTRFKIFLKPGEMPTKFIDVVEAESDES